MYDETDRPVPLPDEMLPVTLPEVTDFRPVPQDDESDPVPALARADGWAEVTLDLGDGPKRYRRELNVMPEWAWLLLGTTCATWTPPTTRRPSTPASTTA